MFMLEENVQMTITQLQINLVNCLLRKILIILSAQNMNMIYSFFQSSKNSLKKRYTEPGGLMRGKC